MSMKLISTTTLGSAASNIEFTNIPGTYTDLYVIYSFRTTASANSNAIYISLNGSTANFTARYLQGNGSAVASGTETRMVGYASAASDTSNTFGSSSIYIPNYAGSTNKSISTDGVSENNSGLAVQALTANLWSNTAAITSLTLASATAGANLVTGSTASLYGITKGSDGVTTAT